MAGKRRSIHVEGIQHGAPIPMGALVGNVLFSSGIMGTDPATGKVPEDLESQCELAFANMKALVENAGGAVEDIGSIKSVDEGPGPTGGGEPALAEDVPRREQPARPPRH